jgi:ParB-like chromosome segregation protein Spo0J
MSEISVHEIIPQKAKVRKTDDDFVSVRDAAAESGTTTSFIRRQLRAGVLPVSRGKVRVSDVRAAHVAHEDLMKARHDLHRELRVSIGPKARKVELVQVDAINVLPGRRPINLAAAKLIAESIKRIGLQSPISIRRLGDTSELVTGGHRLAAAKLLGWETIEAFSIEGDDVNARLLEIAENLHRADLTTLERDEQVAEWVKLTTDGFSDNLSGNPLGGRPESGAAAASRELGIDERDVQRAVKVSSLAPEAKQAARDAGLDDNRSALLAAAKETTPEAQVAALVNRKPIDQGKLDRDLRLRAISEISLLINDHVPNDMRIAIRKNFEVLGNECKAIAAAIEKVEARRR